MSNINTGADNFTHATERKSDQTTGNPSVQSLSTSFAPHKELDLSHDAQTDRGLRVQFHNLLISNQLPLDQFLVPEQTHNLTVFLKLACLYDEKILKTFADKNFESLAKVCCLTESEEIHRMSDYILGYAEKYHGVHNINGHKSNRGLQLEIKSSSLGFSDFKLDIDQLLLNTGVPNKENQSVDLNTQIEPKKLDSLKNWMVKAETMPNGESLISAVNFLTGASLKITSAGEITSSATGFSNNEFVPANLKVQVFDYKTLFENIDLVEWINKKKVNLNPEFSNYALKSLGDKLYCFRNGCSTNFMTRVLSPLDGRNFRPEEDVFIMARTRYVTNEDDDCYVYATRHVSAITANGTMRTFYPSDIDADLSESRLLSWVGAGHGRWHDFKAALGKLWRGC